MIHKFFWVALLMISCKNPVANKENTRNSIQSQTDSNATDLLNGKERLSIILDNSDTITFATKEVKVYLQSAPELVQSTPDAPDITYAISMHNYYGYGSGTKRSIFSSEAGKDEYYVLYSYFLANKNGIEKYSDQRTKLIAIYRNINALSGALSHGGTYYGHQYKRILAYAEYSIYKYSTNESFYKESYTLAEQKKLFLNSLREKIDNEISIDSALQSSAEKTKQKIGLYSFVAAIDMLTTDYFLLSSAQAFQYYYY